MGGGGRTGLTKPFTDSEPVGSGLLAVLWAASDDKDGDPFPCELPSELQKPAVAVSATGSPAGWGTGEERGAQVA